MSLVDTCASLVALPIAWALIALKHAIPAAPERHYRCILVRVVDPPKPQVDATRESEFDLAPTADVSWVSPADIHHEHYVH